jgi:molybdopterin converting factor small subunit
MTIKILFFGIFSDIIGQSEMQLNSVSNSKELKEFLLKNYPKTEHYSFRISCNRELIKGETDFSDNDEIAILPPFAGG